MFKITYIYMLCLRKYALTYIILVFYGIYKKNIDLFK